MTLEIYWGSGSPYAWRVLLAAEIKKLPYESKLLEFSKGDLKKPEFLALNPRGKVPVLRDGDVVVSESLAILAYLDRKYPEPPLFGRTPEEAARAWTWVSDFDSYVREPLLVVNRWLLGDKPRSPDVDEALAKVTPEVQRVEERLGKTPWLAGEAVSVADLVWFPFMRLVVRLDARVDARCRELGLDAFTTKHPHIGAWIARVEALPGYDRTFPPHWR